MMNSICSSNRYYSVFLAETLAGEIDKVKSRLSGHWQGMIRNFWLVVCSNAIFYFTFFSLAARNRFLCGCYWTHVGCRAVVIIQILSQIVPDWCTVTFRDCCVGALLISETSIPTFLVNCISKYVFATPRCWLITLKYSMMAPKWV